MWVWRPGEYEPVVAGVLRQRGPLIAFSYGRSYLDRENFPLYLPELPLGSPEIAPEHDEVAGCIHDASPDGWGRHVIRHRLQIDPGAAEPGLLDYLLLSGSNRIGALDFQTSPTEYVHRGTTGVTLDDLMRAADAVEAGEELAPELRDALLLESSPGGASTQRP